MVPPQASPARTRTTHGYHSRQFPRRTTGSAESVDHHQPWARPRVPPTIPSGAPKHGAPPNPRRCRPQSPRRRRSVNHPRWAPAPAGASPAGAQGRPGGGAEADSDGIAGAAASQSTASQWTRDPDPRREGRRPPPPHPEASTSPAPGLAAPDRGRIADGRTDVVRHGAARIGRRPVVSRRAGAGGQRHPRRAQSQEHTPVHVGVGAPKPPQTTNWPTPSSTDPAASTSTTGSYDWDAATAAALSDEPATPDPASPPHHHTPTTADRLLEDIIREIVGDAAAETVSSLQPERPAPPAARSAPRRWISCHAVDPSERTRPGRRACRRAEPEPASTSSSLRPPRPGLDRLGTERRPNRALHHIRFPVAVDPRDSPRAWAQRSAPEDSPPTSHGAETHAAEERRFPTLPKRRGFPRHRGASPRRRARQPRPPPARRTAREPRPRPVALTSEFRRTTARTTTPSCRVSSPVPRR